MSESNSNNSFKEAVCIEAMRIFDSCSSQDCLEDLELSFRDPLDQEIVDSASYIKTKCVEVANTSFTIDPVPFNSGFYTVDITFTFKVELEVFSRDRHSPEYISATTDFSKKVILFGSSGKTKRFSSDDNNRRKKSYEDGCFEENLPIATVSVVEPISLDTKLIDSSRCADNKDVLVTIGMFSIVQLQRPVPILIPVYDYCIPDKECSTNTDSPCELFNRIQFPTDEFFPKGLGSDEDDCDNKKEEVIVESTRENPRDNRR